MYSEVKTPVDRHLSLPTSTPHANQRESQIHNVGLSMHKNNTGHTALAYRKRLLLNLSWVKQGRLYHRLLVMQETRNISSWIRQPKCSPLNRKHRLLNCMDYYCWPIFEIYNYCNLLASRRFFNFMASECNNPVTILTLGIKITL